MKTQLLILITGHNASGKSTLSKKIESNFNISRVNGDIIRDLIINTVKYYSDTHYSYPNKKIKSANKIVSLFRKELIKELILQNQSVLIDGAGITKGRRKIYLDLKKLSQNKIITIIIEATLVEHLLLERLKNRDKKNNKYKWYDFYKDIRKEKYESVEESEADFILKYNQNNSEEIIKAIKNIQIKTGAK